jgi:ATP-dependent DNA helicase RecG
MNLSFVLKLIKEGESERIEFKRDVTKDIYKEVCALANADGGYILIGIDDEGDIIGCDVKKVLDTIANSLQSITPPPKIKTHKFSIENKDVIVIEVEKSNTLCSVGGVAYIRIGTGIRPLSIQEIITLSAELGTINWDEMPSVGVEHINMDYVRWFFETMERARGKKISEEMWMKYLKSVKAVKGDKLTNAGVLFFTDASRFLQCKCRVVFIDEEPRSSKEYEGPVWKMIDEVFADIAREVQRIDVVVVTKRIKIEEYPLRALREAIINAFAHRNYAIQSDIRIFIYPDRIVIRNPGGLMPGVDLNDPEHIPRNPALCQLLYDTGFIEKYGCGIVMIREECKKHPLVTVEFKATANKFEVIFKKDVQSILEEIDRNILKILSTPKRSGEIAKELGISKPTVLSHLKKLEGLGLVKKEGISPHIKYRTV